MCCLILGTGTYVQSGAPFLGRKACFPSLMLRNSSTKPAKNFSFNLHPSHFASSRSCKRIYLLSNPSAEITKAMKEHPSVQAEIDSALEVANNQAANAPEVDIVANAQRLNGSGTGLQVSMLSKILTVRD